MTMLLYVCEEGGGSGGVAERGTGCVFKNGDPGRYFAFSRMFSAASSSDVGSPSRWRQTVDIQTDRQIDRQ